MSLTTVNTSFSPRRSKRQAGSTLIEVLISLLVLSGGMMGMAGLQTVSLQANQNAFFRTQATTFTLDIVERMRTNLTAVQNGDYNDVVGAATASCFTVAGCTSAQMAAQDVLDWEATVAAGWAMPWSVSMRHQTMALPMPKPAATPAPSMRSRSGGTMTVAGLRISVMSPPFNRFEREAICTG